MIARFDRLLDGITMYRLVLYALAAYVAVAAALAGFGLLSFTPVALLVSAAFLVAVCWGTNVILGWVFDVPTNAESAIITGLILALIVNPPASPGDLQFLAWAAILAMASKYILTLRNSLIFNPAAIAVVVTAFALGASASWWVGTVSMLPIVLLGGLLVVRKLRDVSLMPSFLAAALIAVCLVSIKLGYSVPRELWQLVAQSPLLFFGSIMLTEPLTTPPRKGLRILYGALVGVLITPQFHVGGLYSTPELALVAGNAFAYLISPKQRVTLWLRKKTWLARDMGDFAFTPSAKLAFRPGQYLEVTLGHAQPDSRGNRRYFTLASSPTEDVVHLGVRFYEQSSSFKHALYDLPRGSSMMGGQVAGNFTLPRNPRQKLVFIAGGIGITPFRSMLKYLIDTQQRRDIILLYANKAPNDVIYWDVLRDARSKLGVRTIFTLTDAEAIPWDWPGYIGRVDARVIHDAVPDYRTRTFYLSGPPEMVRAHERVLQELGVRRMHIKKDFFAGLV